MNHRHTRYCSCPRLEALAAQERRLERRAQAELEAELHTGPLYRSPAQMRAAVASLGERNSPHAGGRLGQKCKAKARRRGTHGKAVRRRALAARRRS